MPLDARRLGRSIVAGWDLLILESRFLMGNRGVVLGFLQLAVVAIVAVAQRLKDEPWDAASLYNRCLVLPGLLPALVIGMSLVMEEKDVRHLEVTFASPGGRYQVWSFRLAATWLGLTASVLACSALTWAFVERDHPIVSSALHAGLPLAFVATVTAALSVVFRGAASAALTTAVLVGLSGMVLHSSAPNRFDLFLNPLDVPQDLLDPKAWFRILVFNRCFLVAMTGLATWLLLFAVQRRERLL